MMDLAVTRRDERLRGVQWPQLRKVKTPNVEAGDCVLVCAGFEERAVSGLARICGSGRGEGVVVGLINYAPEVTENRKDELLKIGGRHRLKLAEFVYDRERPAGMGERLADFAKAFRRVFVDISGMSRLLIVQTVASLLGAGNLRVSIIYTTAKMYPPSRAQFEKDLKDAQASPTASYLSSGILDIAATPELGSVAMVGESVRLIAFPSFDPAQLTNVVQELQPTYVEYIHGKPPEKEADGWRTTAIRKLNSRILREVTGREHENSTLDYRETLETLFRVYAERSMFDRLVVAPTGSKMQAVAVGVFRAGLHDVQIVYPTPQVFAKPDEYTVGARDLYQLDLPARAIAKALVDVKVGERDV